MLQPDHSPAASHHHPAAVLLAGCVGWRRPRSYWGQHGCGVSPREPSSCWIGGQGRGRGRRHPLAALVLPNLPRPLAPVPRRLLAAPVVLAVRLRQAHCCLRGLVQVLPQLTHQNILPLLLPLLVPLLAALAALLVSLLLLLPVLLLVLQRCHHPPLCCHPPDTSDAAVLLPASAKCKQGNTTT